MTWILTNDDGIDAPGLRALEEAVRDLGSLVICAPDEEQSGIGHQVTMHGSIAVREEAPGRFRVDGTPADCTRIALRGLALDAEWLLAGINRGGNLGADAYMSGTIAAAREAALLGVPAVAVSQYVGPQRQVDWDVTARRARRALEDVLSRPQDGRFFWSINLPSLESAPPDTDPELVFCPLDPCPLGVAYHRDGDAFVYAGDYHSRPRAAGHDVDVCMGGRIAITRIPLELRAD